MKSQYHNPCFFRKLMWHSIEWMHNHIQKSKFWKVKNHSTKRRLEPRIPLRQGSRFFNPRWNWWFLAYFIQTVGAMGLKSVGIVFATSDADLRFTLGPQNRNWMRKKGYKYDKKLIFFMSDICPNLHITISQQLPIIFFIMCWTIDDPHHCTNHTLS